MNSWTLPIDTLRFFAPRSGLGSRESIRNPAILDPHFLSDNVLSAARELEADFFGYDFKYSPVAADTSGPIDILSPDEIEF